ncbi:SDR family NAD(P)-dependent oxidoreductase [Dyadobacter psychrotolerans]|uniref:SDR family NAD(P)-dependent oxidoreductase n=1 Tax=Dyadobacter psychrotolerans TaxID=2541721 RepID=A0A4V2Z2Z8_9BACT|nr:SDR family NAD(P)-dependent oxidoreductase [Dyadobacter psychrotolerans]TDE10788.1 SDR family NAD(P)-dependent oxidoreductase [Dyadobacter psychrotolerans]
MKHIILTGSSSGFGMITAQVLAKSGHQVYATMRNIHTSNADTAKNLRHWAEQQHVNIQIVELDVTSDVSVEKAVREILSHSEGKIDVLINNAGSAFIGLNETLSATQTDQMFQINVIGVDRMIKAVLPFMHLQKNGLIITLSSVASRQPIPIMGAYGATKAAVDALSVSYYYELMSSGIDVAIVQPGAYPSTDIFTRQAIPANPDSEKYYGADMRKFKASVVNLFTPGPENPDTAEVAGVIAELIGQEKGQRQLWTIINGGPLADSISETNQSIRQIVDTILYAAGVAKQSPSLQNHH